MYADFKTIVDHWIRRRVRMAYWRQWRKPRTKVRNLMKLGVRVQAAVACGITSTKSRHHEAKAHGVALKPRESFNKENQALSNAYLKTEGLYSLRDGCFLS